MIVARTGLAAFFMMALLGPATSAVGTVPPDGARFQPGRYLVDARRTTVHFRVKSLFGRYEGDFIEPVGDVVIAAGRTGRAEIDISFPVSRLTTGDASTDQMLKGSTFFDMDRHPTIRFTASNAPTEGETLRIDGKLDMHGRTRPITIAARFAGSGPEDGGQHISLRFTGKASVKRSQFGMGFGRPFVANRVDLNIDATFRLAPPSSSG